jgi:hypothetical protein
MPELDKLTDWEKLGLYWATDDWIWVRSFRAPLSIGRLEELGLVETAIKTSEWKGRTLRTEMVRLTPSGRQARDAVRASEFDGWAQIKRRK